MSSVKLYETASVAETRPMPSAMPVTTGSVATMADYAGQITLRRTGQRPLQFRGTEMCSAMGYNETGHLWHEINIYKTDSGKYIADIRVFKKVKGERDSFHVEQCDSFDEAISVLERFDPRCDVVADLRFADPNATTAELAVHAVELKQRLDDASKQYRAVLGDLLYELNRHS